MGRAWLRILGDHASFRTPRAACLNFAIVFAILALLPTRLLWLLPVRSVWENVFHVTPWSSGTTRALSRLLHGDLAGALAYNRFVLLTFGVMLALFVVNAWRWWREARHDRVSL